MRTADGAGADYRNCNCNFGHPYVSSMLAIVLSLPVAFVK
jgi:hypothetical protein